MQLSIPKSIPTNCVLMWKCSLSLHYYLLTQSSQDDWKGLLQTLTESSTNIYYSGLSEGAFQELYPQSLETACGRSLVLLLRHFDCVLENRSDPFSGSWCAAAGTFKATLLLWFISDVFRMTVAVFFTLPASIHRLLQPRVPPWLKICSISSRKQWKV